MLQTLAAGSLGHGQFSTELPTKRKRGWGKAVEIGDARELFTWHTSCVDGASQTLGRDTLSVPPCSRAELRLWRGRAQAGSGTTLTVISATTPGIRRTSTLKSPSILIGARR